MRKTSLFLLCCLTLAGLQAQTGNTSWIAQGGNLVFGEIPAFRQAGGTSGTDYTNGVFIVNEDWFGHQNSTVNYLNADGEWVYRAFQKENPGHELGCTTSFGTIYGGLFYFVSKQERDPGATAKGSRFAVCDAKTMKVLKEFEFIGTKTVKGSAGQDSLVSIADGRSYLPVDEHKGYIGTSNGIWLYDSDNMTIGKQIEGTGNPNEGGYGQLYYAQIGTMLRVGDRVFAVHQKNGLLVINANTDQVEQTLLNPEDNDKAGLGSIVLSKDGTLWASVTKDVSGSGATLPHFWKIDPYTLQTEKIAIPTAEGIESITNSWYAWTAGSFCASKQENKLYWDGQSEKGSWFAGYTIFSYDIDKKKFEKVFDLNTYPGKWRLYGTGFRVHPVTNELYCFFYHEFLNPTHMLVRINSKGEVVKEYTMIQNYWFPSLPVFPDNAKPEVASTFPSAVYLTENAKEYKLWLGDQVRDEDNMEAAIVKTVSSVTPASPVNAIIRNDSLLIGSDKPVSEKHQAVITIRFNSNGQFVEKEINVNTGESPTSTEKTEAVETRVYPNPATDHINVVVPSVATVSIYSLNGTLVNNTVITSSDRIAVNHLPKGIYIVKISAGNKTTVHKLLKQ